MLDTQFTHYQDAVIGTVLTTLHAGSVLLTFYPNFNLSLQDPHLSTALQVQVQIQGFNSKVYPVYPAKLNGHFLWDSPGSGNCDPDCPCWDDWDEDDDELKWRSKPKKKLPKTSCSHHQHKPPHNPPPPPAPLPIYQKELSWIAKNCKTNILSNIQHSTPPIQPMAYMMFSSTSQDYSSNFSAIETHTDPQQKLITKPFIPSAITPTGHLEDPKPFEDVLNWQTKNARAQNETLADIHKKINHISLRTDHLESKMDSIASQMQQIYQNLYSRISQLDSELRTISKPHPRPRPEKQPFQPPLSISEQHRPLYPPLPPQPTPTQTKDKSPMQQYSAQLIPDPSDTDQTSDSNLVVSADSSESETDSSLESSISSSDSEKSYADITRILMAQPDETEPAQSSRTDPFFDIPSDIEEDPPEATSAPTRPAQNDHKPSNGPWFTFDDIPAAKWRDSGLSVPFNVGLNHDYLNLLMQSLHWRLVQLLESELGFLRKIGVIKGKIKVGIDSENNTASMQGSEDSTNGSLLILFESGVKECNTGCDRKTFSPMEGENKADTTEMKVSVSPKKKNIIYRACKLYLLEDDDDEPDYPPPLPLYTKGLQWIQKHQPRSCKPVRSSAGLLPTPPMVPCMMFSSASAADYSSEYPPLEKRSDQKHQVWSKPFVNSPISSSGH
ncbi:hypothetical protein KPL71_021636 [Citrus sinensis]|uniref:Uncharacterized protein n=1 Tax=Citrus sinensis TaxID=2711 RepID=A0ACB8JGU1_CITSI|nr:hypothetical protein KPL71_021636 [Citrus sinensis]